MVRTMLKWRPWLPISSKKFSVKLVLQKIKVSDVVKDEIRLLMAEIRWKGAKVGIGLRKSIKNCTKEVQFNEKLGVLEWNEEFENVCGLIVHKENGFCSCEVEIRVFNVSRQGFMKKTSLVGTAILDLADFTSTTNEEIDLNLQLSSLPNVVSPFSLNLTLRLLELGNSQESIETIQKSPVLLSPSSGDSIIFEKDDFSPFKFGLRIVISLKDLLAILKAKKNGREESDIEGRYTYKNEDVESPFPFDSESLFDVGNEGETEEEDVRKSIEYDSLAVANYFGGLIFEQESLIYFSHNKLDLEYSNTDHIGLYCDDQGTMPSPKKSILPWKKRKLSLRSPKTKGEPLLKKGNREEGGDDIDYDRRLLGSSAESLSGSNQKIKNLSQPEFGDDTFTVGSWELKEITSRDSHMKLRTKVFFASIDQRSEQAAGESACTALVAVIAHWFQSNPNTMPIKSQFDSLIREGSLEWRNLCENQTTLEKFPDKHFDLDTVLESKIRSLSVNSDKSFIGFFQPEGMEKESNSGFDFLHGAMSFDSIWDEISKTDDGSENIKLYIVSWNDHFFVLMVGTDAYYIIDTLGERLHEGCDQAYILKFDASTVIHNEVLENSTKRGSDAKQENTETYLADEELVCRGKESCKEYIKSFLAAIPIRELQIDIKKGLRASTHRRLQIEFHYTESAKEDVCAENEEQSLELVGLEGKVG